MDGRVVLVTVASRGIGLAAAAGLAGGPGNSSTPPAHGALVEPVVRDVSSLAELRAFAGRFRAGEPAGRAGQQRRGRRARPWCGAPRPPVGSTRPPARSTGSNLPPTLSRTATRQVVRTPQEGADTLVWLGAAPGAVRTSGLLRHDRRPRPVTYALGAGPDSARARDELWQYVFELTRSPRDGE